jgi:hypothetical protein
MKACKLPQFWTFQQSWCDWLMSSPTRPLTDVDTKVIPAAAGIFWG